MFIVGFAFSNALAMFTESVLEVRCLSIRVREIVSEVVMNINFRKGRTGQQHYRVSDCMGSS